MAGCWFQPYPSEKHEFVSWDDDYILPIYGKMKNVPNHQPGYVMIYDLLHVQYPKI